MTDSPAEVPAPVPVTAQSASPAPQAAQETGDLCTLTEALEALPKRPRGAAGQLTRAEISCLITAIKDGWGNQRIAAVLNMDSSTVSKWRSRLRPTVMEARAVLAGSSLDAALAWRKSIPIAAGRGDHRPAKELLQATGAIDQEQHAGVTVNIGMGASAMGIDPFQVSVSNNGSSVK